MMATRSALGSDYEARLRKEAGPDPGKMAKRKHQIGSLYHQAKAQELEQLERVGPWAGTAVRLEQSCGFCVLYSVLTAGFGDLDVLAGTTMLHGCGHTPYLTPHTTA